MPTNRSAWHDTHIYASNDRDTVLGGLRVAPGITNANLYSMVGIFCTITDTFDLQDGSQRLVERDEEQLRPGNYYIFTKGSITVTNEVPLLCTLSLHSGTRVESFFDSVCNRDRRCVITGRSVEINGVTYWGPFGAADEHWGHCNLSHWITVPPASVSHGTINSMQNGILLIRDMHTLFDCYQISINPDDHHKIVCFTPIANSYGIAGRQLDQSFLDDPLRPDDHLLRWHFRQAVLVNMKGVGEPCFEIDFPPGSDMMSQIMSGPKAVERMEFELFGCLNAKGDRA
ncbi:hypothetical protein HOY80DRAFT_948802 [Tuber brumale]|nr:hypothetical protein HOY80DRAFT_948802 [Tuber brumale]